MTRLLITILTVALLNISDATAQEHAKGKCTNDITWTYDGQTLTLTNVSDPLLQRKTKMRRGCCTAA